MPDEQHPASFINATKQGDTEQLYQIEVEHPKTKRHFLGAMAGTREIPDDKLTLRAQAHWPGWKIVSVTPVESVERIKKNGEALTAKQGPGVPLDELTDGEPNAIMANPDLADPDYDPDKA